VSGTVYFNHLVGNNYEV